MWRGVGPGYGSDALDFDLHSRLNLRPAHQEGSEAEASRAWEGRLAEQLTEAHVLGAVLAPSEIEVPRPKASPIYGKVKAVVDVAVATVLLVLSTPVMVGIGDSYLARLAGADPLSPAAGLACAGNPSPFTSFGRWSRTRPNIPTRWPCAISESLASVAGSVGQASTSFRR